MNVNDDCARFGFRRDLHRWQKLVSPAWLAGLLAQTPVVAAPAADWRLFEIGFDSFDAFLDCHIAGAAYIDTLQLESGAAIRTTRSYAGSLLPGSNGSSIRIAGLGLLLPEV